MKNFKKKKYMPTQITQNLEKQSNKVLAIKTHMF